MEDQVKEAENFGINAKSISELELSEEGLSQVQLLFGSAEEIIDDNFLSCLKECSIETWTGLR